MTRSGRLSFRRVRPVLVQPAQIPYQFLVRLPYGYNSL